MIHAPDNVGLSDRRSGYKVAFSQRFGATYSLPIHLLSWSKQQMDDLVGAGLDSVRREKMVWDIRRRKEWLDSRRRVIRTEHVWTQGER